MNYSVSMIRNSLLAGMVAAGLLAHAAVFAGDSKEVADALQAEKEQLLRRQQEMLAAVEASRIEAERAAEAAREKAEKLRAEAEKLRAESLGVAREADEQREAHMREIERARRDLARTQRELQHASREIIRAHRELAFADHRRLRAEVINLGDRAMLGVILGEETGDGIRIVGLSPDGPAQRAGLETGDVIVSLRGKNLGSSDGRSPREVIFEVMSGVEDGEEISVGVMRDGARRDFMVRPEKREPASWASYIRLPEPPAPVGAAPDAPDAPNAPDAPELRFETIVIPPVDSTALVAQAEALSKEFEALGAVLADGAFEFDFDSESLSELGTAALSHASMFFETTATAGIRFADLNEGLGSYFDADRGVLVLDAPKGNPLALRAGDVVLKIGDSEVRAISDIFRALRDFGAGDEIRMAIKRSKRDESFTVTMPENRFGMLEHHMNGRDVHLN